MEYQKLLWQLRLTLQFAVLCLPFEGGSEVTLPSNSFYGPITLSINDQQGNICSSGFDDIAARVACSELGYTGGKAVTSYKTESPIIFDNVRCTGREEKLGNCAFSVIRDSNVSNTIAAVICYHGDGVEFSLRRPISTTSSFMTRVQIKVDEVVMYVSYSTFTDTDAAVYCRSIGYAGGKAVFRKTAPYDSFHIKNLTCHGNESNILQCPAFWDPDKVKGYQMYHAEVKCRPEIYLEGTDNRNYGVAILTNENETGLIDSEGFDLTIADVICRTLGFENGLSACCDPFGAVNEKKLIRSVSCSGKEAKLAQCSYEYASTYVQDNVSRNYSTVACYSGRKSEGFSLGIHTSQRSFVGPLILTYMNITGGVCPDGWDDGDARVACKELGYKHGISFNAVKLHIAFNGPFWTSNVQCHGEEKKLKECNMTLLGQVTTCAHMDKVASVACFDSQGMEFRLSGTDEPRQGRVEMSVNYIWRSLCVDYWTDVESHVLCRMLGYSTGDTVIRIKSSAQWDVRFKCNMTSVSLTNCFKMTDACARRHEEVGAFCYKSVKLSTGTGRQADNGIVLLYLNNTWYSVCADNFTNTSARVVCKELGFRDGDVRHTQDRLLNVFPLLRSHKIICRGGEEEVSQCLVESSCDGHDFASVICYNTSLHIRTSNNTLHEASDKVQKAVVISVVVTTVLVLLIISVVCIGRRRRVLKYQSVMQYSSRKKRGDGDVLIDSISKI